MEVRLESKVFTQITRELDYIQKGRLDRVTIESMLVVSLDTILSVALVGKHGSPERYSCWALTSAHTGLHLHSN